MYPGRLWRYQDRRPMAEQASEGCTAENNLAVYKGHESGPDNMEDTMNECAGLWGKLFGHKFQARMDESMSAAPVTTIDSYTSIVHGASGMAMMLDTLRDAKQTYVHDVCVRCGTVIKRGGDTNV